MQDVEHINPYLDDDRAKEEQVAEMFDAISSEYDLMNSLMTFGLDRVWLRRLVKAAVEGNPKCVLDLATGTGEVAIELHRRLPNSEITGLDISEGMLSKAREKKAAEGINFICADGLATGLSEASFDAITIAYGIRNYADMEAGLREMYRLLCSGGRLCILELSEPPNVILKVLYKLYTRTLVPLMGKITAGNARAYTYLPESIAACPQREAMTALMSNTGFSDCKFRSFTFGVCTLYTAVRQ